MVLPMKKYLSFLFALFAAPVFADGVIIENKDIQLLSMFRFKMQNRFTFETQDTKNLSGREADFAVRRMRFRLDGSVLDPRLIFKMQVGFSNQDIGPDRNSLMDAAAGWKFTPKTTLWIGQMKLPGNREQLISSEDLNLVDRSILNNEFTLDRDLGVQLHQEFFTDIPLRFKLALSNGEGRSRENQDSGMSYTGRVELLPFGHFKNNGDVVMGDFSYEENAKLSLGGTYNSMKKVHRASGTIGPVITEENISLSTTVFDFMMKYRGISWSGDYIKRWISADNGISGDGFSSQIGKMLSENYEPVVRYTQVTGTDKLKQSTIGLNKYLRNHRIKLQSDLSYSDGPDRSYWTWRFQFDLGI